MSNSEIICLPKTTDHQILSFFTGLTDELDFSPASVRISGAAEPIAPGSDNPLLIEIGERNGTSIVYVHASKHIDANKIPSVVFEKGFKKNVNSATEPSLYVDTILINNYQFVDVQMALKIHGLINDQLISRSVPAFPGGDQNSLAQLINTHHQLISQIHQQIAAVGTDYASARTKLEEELAERKAKL